ncbi:uncharacterized protein [Rutidosis leptorrhynchoides]|uniref:uncharacterized protein n=1 Tax=Rutidosis leptorrhynchoides TaxID=125765 RepID=UPI003A9A31FA
MHRGFVGNEPWLLMGDFNVSLRIDESTASASSSSIAMREFQECVDRLSMSDINCSGFRFTWNQRPRALSGTLKKIDRVMGNDVFIDRYTNAYAVFYPYRISDHCPAVIKLPLTRSAKPKPFRFANFVTHHEDFKQIVSNAWVNEVRGHALFRLVKKLCMLKKPMRKLMWCKGNIHTKVVECRAKLDVAQKHLDDDPFSIQKLSWSVKLLRNIMKVGDSNSRFFHKVVKSKANRSRISAVVDSNGNFIEGSEVPKNTISDQQAALMIRPVTTLEIKEAFFNIGDSKSPGPDGYSAAFFKEGWDIVGDDVVQAVKEFFSYRANAKRC